MDKVRRQVIGGAAALGLLSTRLGAQNADNPQQFRDIFGLPNYRNKNPDLKFLKSAQEQKLMAPHEIEAFQAYLTRQPLVQSITAGVGPELYHLLQWNSFALDLTAQDHTTTSGAGSDPLYAEQYGPHRASRALAIIHLAVFEAVNSIYQRAMSYRDIQSKIYAAVGMGAKDVNAQTASVRAAIAVAAHDTMVVLYPNKSVLVESQYRLLVPAIPDSPGMQGLGVAIGTAAANQVLLTRKYDYATKRFSDGSETDGKSLLPRKNNTSFDFEPLAADLTKAAGVDDWQVDPITQLPYAIGGWWNFVEPFVLDPKSLFLPSGPPKNGSGAFQKAYDDVRAAGGDPSPPALGTRHPSKTTRTGTSASDPLNDTNETFKGLFWAYDGTALLCAPPRMYNMMATSVALNEHPITEVAEMARYLAMVNVVLADCGVAAWTAKFNFHVARPVTYIRNHDPNKSVLNTLNRDWTPLGAPVDNASPSSANLTPPFPAYPSGHAVFGGGLFQTMRKVHGGDRSFQFVSDEYNGLNRGPTGDTRPRMQRTFPSFTAAEAENGRSRIWLGIHWQFDADDGIKQGNMVADYIMKNAFSLKS